MKKSLKLRKETIRELRSVELPKVGGGGATLDTCGAATCLCTSGGVRCLTNYGCATGA